MVMLRSYTTLQAFLLLVNSPHSTLGVQKASQGWAKLGASFSKSLGCSLFGRVLPAGLCFKQTSFVQRHCGGTGSDVISRWHLGIILKLEPMN